MEFDFKSFKNIETEFEDLFIHLSSVQSQIHKKIKKYADNKVLKGNELVGGWGRLTSPPKKCATCKVAKSVKLTKSKEISAPF